MANKIDDGLRTAVLLTAVGSSNYDLLNTLVAPVSQKDKPYDEIMYALTSYFSQKPLFFAEHFYFYRCDQQTRNSVGMHMVMFC